MPEPTDRPAPFIPRTIVLPPPPTGGGSAQPSRPRPIRTLATEWSSITTVLGTLSPAHAKMLIGESGITEEVVRARGYYTVTTKAQGRRVGFSDGQLTMARTSGNRPATCSALVLPVYSCFSAGNGIAGTFQLRPDAPRRDSEGRPIKYETPGGSRMLLDVHPLARPWLG